MYSVVTGITSTPESCDVVIIGARLAGASAAAHMARAGLDVVALDRSSFPSDQLSTHLLFPDGINEIRRMGALPGILSHNPTRSPWMQLVVNHGRPDESRILERWRPAGPIDYCLCVPRILQDVELVNAARAAGADVRERHRLVEVLWRGGRACGVRYADRDGNQFDLMAKLVIGADGRRSSVAAQVGAFAPYRASRNGRALVFRYGDDPQFGTQAGQTIHQWRDEDSMAFLFPSTPAGRMLMLFMGPAQEAAEASKDPEGYWDRKLAVHPGMAERCRGAENLSGLRATGDTTSYFRASSGPGWVLIGDAGHFKDPVIGQGQRDALWSGRRLAEMLGTRLGSSWEIDQATREWEHERDRECLHAYHFGNIETQVRTVPPVLSGAIRRSGRKGLQRPDFTDVFGRARSITEVLTGPRIVAGTASALRHNTAELLSAQGVRDLLMDVRTQFELRRQTKSTDFRCTRDVFGSDNADPTPPAPVRPVARAANDAATPNTETAPPSHAQATATAEIGV
ncbi:hypothetical protein MPHO_50880 [Mycolicibacterium phocaicum]|uniref:NAD(P)/FAD-dependent oxidoreductase n=1 Tax=Mycolicibacterium phocaicum TaxID=319706 RepID=A0A7I7ZUZ7_9MYCO|nr:NAD(P)/FAD-dependent oxidoreductase [Mycolicibacterium phocaicum]BBZ58096.1 hypothetical protein MPHO_50880 [Mycolicibacterium phocaicum]